MTQTKIPESHNKAIRTWQAYPHRFIGEVLGWEPWEKQQEVLYSVRDNKETYVKSCNAAGKTYLAAGIVLWWLFTRRGKVVTTAPTWRQVREILWANIGAQCERAPQLGVKPLQTQLKLAADWFAVGLSTKVPDKFQGYHTNVLVVVDEASGVEDPAIWAAIDGNLTDHKHDRLLAIGNPLDPESVFAKKFKIPEKKGMNKHITISAFDTPNVKQGKEVIRGLVTKEWVEQKLLEWGENSPLYQARVLGEFPRVGLSALIPLHWWERAFNYNTSGHLEPTRDFESEWVSGSPDVSEGIHSLGLDVSGSGMDNNAMTLLTGKKLQAIIGWPGVDSSDILGDDNEVHTQPTFYDWVYMHRPEVGIIDAEGLGDPIYRYAQKYLKKKKHELKGFRLRSFKSSRSAIRGDKFGNYKAESYWYLRNIMQENMLDLSNTPREMQETLQTQGSAINWRINAKGLIFIEDKDKMRARVGFSPDELESLIMALSATRRTNVDKHTYAGFDYNDETSDIYGEDESMHGVGKFDYDLLHYMR